VFSSVILQTTNPPREADELYQKLRAVPQGDDKPWIQPWLAFGAKKNTARAMEYLTRHLLGSMILV
jgi:hypothetical protein